MSLRTRVLWRVTNFLAVLLYSGLAISMYSGICTHLEGSESEALWSLLVLTYVSSPRDICAGIFSSLYLSFHDELFALGLCIEWWCLWHPEHVLTIPWWHASME